MRTPKYERCKLTKGNPCVSCAKGIKLDALITQAQKRLDDLLSRRQKLHTEINTVHERIIHRLPPEISSTIFLFSLSKREPRSNFDICWENSRDESTVITTPLTLGAVCRLWRRIVWTSPRLWTDISITTIPDVINDHQYIDVLSKWLQRSGQLPLSMRFYAHLHALDSCDTRWRDYLSSLITNYLPRCRRLEISCPLGHFPEVYGEAPILEELKIVSDDEDIYSRDVELSSTKSEGICISLTGYCLAALTLPFRHVSNFEGIITFDECITILKESPNLVEFQILGCKAVAPSSEEPIIHNQVKRLALLASDGLDPPDDLLNILNFPSLTHLMVEQIGLLSLQDFLLRSGCNLRSLHLKSLSLQGQKLDDILRSTSALEELSLFHQNVSELDLTNVFEGIIHNNLIDGQASSFLPNLSILIIRFGTEHPFPWDLATRIFESNDNAQNPLGRPLKYLRFIYNGCTTTYTYFGPPPTPVLTEQATRRFLDAARAGINIDLYDDKNEVDILLYSMMHHKITVPEWYHVKDSLGDPDPQLMEITNDWSDSDEESESDED